MKTRDPSFCQRRIFSVFVQVCLANVDSKRQFLSAMDTNRVKLTGICYLIAFWVQRCAMVDESVIYMVDRSRGIIIESYSQFPEVIAVIFLQYSCVFNATAITSG